MLIVCLANIFICLNYVIVVTLLILMYFVCMRFKVLKMAFECWAGHNVLIE